MKLITLCILLFSMNVFAEKASEKIYQLSKELSAKYTTDTTIVKAIKEQNGKKMTLAQIQELDKKWQADAGVKDYMEKLMTNECGKYLKKIVDERKYIAEIFAMDNQGANVGMTSKTSDYWQGDEDKFKKSFNDGKGDIFVDDVKFDKSTQTYLVQISIPVKEGDKAIGAITFGINVDQYK